ncbi:type II toxin-antitoxin system HicB family antitoxin [Mitsuokella sp.]|uniref:type II toxin-antitoxin system HicB family antitoxin n=1 Tax=Mitsuokella sp. TaxID=2049034 RepID=UPI003D7D136A
MDKPDFYRYIALLDYEKDGVHVTFPDLPGCVTFGADEAEAVREARDVLALHLWGIEDDGEVPPAASTVKVLADAHKLKGNETFFLVDAFMPAIREKMAKRFVKKTLSIPSWLNAQAESYGINFSQTLQKALKQELQLAQ